MLGKLTVALATAAVALAVTGSAGAYLPDGGGGGGVKAGDPCTYAGVADYALDYRTGGLLVCTPSGYWAALN